MSKKQTLEDFVAETDKIMLEERTLTMSELHIISDVVRQKIALAISRPVDEIVVTDGLLRDGSCVVTLLGKISDDYGQKGSNHYALRVKIILKHERRYFINGYSWNVGYKMLEGEYPGELNPSISGWSRNMDKTQSSIFNYIEERIRKYIVQIRVLSRK